MSFRAIARFLPALTLLSACHHASRTSACRLSRDGFLEELTYSRATARTPQFDDYTRGSYHVASREVVDAVYALRPRFDVVGCAVFGPFGPLWAYNLVLFLREGEAIRANWIHMPHARIVLKGTVQVTTDSLEALRVLAAQNLTGVSPSDVVDEPLFIIALGSPDRHDYASRETSDVNGLAASTSAVLQAIEAMLESSTITYSSDLPDPDTIYLPVERPEP